jgi:hypothetical protein
MKNKHLLFKALCLISIIAVTDLQCQTTMIDIQNSVGHQGIGLGAAIAVAISWSRNQSILWAILHGIFGWFYVIYFALTR